MTEETIKELEGELQTLTNPRLSYSLVQLYRPTYDEVLKSHTESFYNWMRKPSSPQKQKSQTRTHNPSSQTQGSPSESVTIQPTQKSYLTRQSGDHTSKECSFIQSTMGTFITSASLPEQIQLSQGGALTKVQESLSEPVSDPDILHVSFTEAHPTRRPVFHIGSSLSPERHLHRKKRKRHSKKKKKHSPVRHQVTET